MNGHQYAKRFLYWDAIHGRHFSWHRTQRRAEKLAQLFVEAGDDAVQTYAGEMAAVASALLGPEHELTRMLADTGAHEGPGPDRPPRG